MTYRDALHLNTTRSSGYLRSCNVADALRLKIELDGWSDRRNAGCDEPSPVPSSADNFTFKTC